MDVSGSCPLCLTPPCYHLRAAGDGGSFFSSTTVSVFWRGARTPVDSDAMASIANRAAIYRYRPRPYPGPIDLFNAEEPYPSPAEDTRLRWRELSPKVLVHSSPGSHHRILNEPEVFNIAERLREGLAAAEA